MTNKCQNVDAVRMKLYGIRLMGQTGLVGFSFYWILYVIRSGITFIKSNHFLFLSEPQSSHFQKSCWKHCLMIYLSSSETGLYLLQGDWAFPNNINTVIGRHTLKILRNTMLNEHLSNNYNRIQSEAKCSHVIYIQYWNQDPADFLGLLCFLSDGHSLILTYSPFIQHSICKLLVQVYHVQLT